MNGQDSKRVNTLRLHKLIWNKEKQQTEPGDLVWEVPCNIELSDSGWITFHLEEEKGVLAGDWYLAFPLGENELHAVYHHARVDTILKKMKVKFKSEGNETR